MQARRLHGGRRRTIYPEFRRIPAAIEDPGDVYVARLIKPEPGHRPTSPRPSRKFRGQCDQAVASGPPTRGSTCEAGGQGIRRGGRAEEQQPLPGAESFDSDRADLREGPRTVCAKEREGAGGRGLPEGRRSKTGGVPGRLAYVKQTIGLTSPEGGRARQWGARAGGPRLTGTSGGTFAEVQRRAVPTRWRKGAAVHRQSAPGDKRSLSGWSTVRVDRTRCSRSGRDSGGRASSVNNAASDAKEGHGGLRSWPPSRRPTRVCFSPIRSGPGRTIIRP